MNLGISGRSALISASSAGLGLACAHALAGEGVHVVINGRDATRLEAAVAQLRVAAPNVEVTGVAADLNTEDGRDALLAALPNPDILVTNNDGPPPTAFQDCTDAHWQAALAANLLAPAHLIRAVIEGMKEREFGRIINITSAMVKSPHPIMGLSTAARSGLTALCKGLSKEAARHNVTINNLLPERFDTGRQQRMAQVAMKMQGITYEEAREQMVRSIAANRLGRPEEFGDACAFLCSAQAGYISGQNLQLDGGSYAAVF